MIVSLYAGGMTVRDIQHHLESTLGTEISHETISNVTDAVAEEVTAWQSRPLEAFYPVIYLDAIVVKIRDGAHVSQPGRAPRRRRGHGRGQARPGHLDPSHRGGQVLGVGVFPAGQPRRAGRAHRLLRRADRVPRGGPGHLVRGDHADVCGAPDPGVDAVRLLRRPQARRRPAAADLHRRRRGQRGPAPRRRPRPGLPAGGRADPGADPGADRHRPGGDAGGRPAGRDQGHRDGHHRPGRPEGPVPARGPGRRCRRRHPARARRPSGGWPATPRSSRSSSTPTGSCCGWAAPAGRSPPRRSGHCGSGTGTAPSPAAERRPPGPTRTTCGTGSTAGTPT